MNLTGADTVIFYDSDWNPAMDAQVSHTLEHYLYKEFLFVKAALVKWSLHQGVLTQKHY